ncbi:MAG: hypothetical protein AAGA10_24750 [Bacteroidota bacterium]
MSTKSIKIDESYHKKQEAEHILPMKEMVEELSEKMESSLQHIKHTSQQKSAKKQKLTNC